MKPRSIILLTTAAVLASAGLVAGSVWWWQARRGEREAARMRMSGEAERGVVHVATAWPVAGAKRAEWTRPAPQSSGPAWLYEVFTPPVIFFNAAARSFSVTAPDQRVDGLPFDLELLAVRRDAFRLQLAGYYGAPGDYVAAFTSPVVPETLLARQGRRFEQLGLTLRRFDVKKVQVGESEAGPLYEVAAQAVLHDERTNAEVVLDSRVRKLSETPLAVLRLFGADDAGRELREGDIWQQGAATYRIERIQLDPPEVVIVKQSPGSPLPETRVLQPGVNPHGVAGARPARTLPTRPATNQAAAARQP